MARNESYVERFTREQTEKEQKEIKKSQKGEKKRGVPGNGTETDKGEGYAAPETEDGRTQALGELPRD